MERELVEQMAEQDELPRLEGENRELTVFFSDIRNFTAFSERYRSDPQTLVTILNTYLTRVSQVLLKHGGCLDKYIGDAVVCLFGAPTPQAEHALFACRAALDVQAEVTLLRQEFHARGWPDVYTRIGVNSDLMFVGNIGSEQLFDYTAIGDGMNLAARLEGANKTYGSLILIGPRTHELVAEHVEVRELDRVRVAGKSEAVPLYELLALRGGLTDAQRKLLPLYAQALGLYREQQFAKALELLAQALEVQAEDGPSLALARRCKHYLQVPPPQPFDGVADLEK
jgi:adenylate cyclase